MKVKEDIEKLFEDPSSPEVLDKNLNRRGAGGGVGGLRPEIYYS